MTLVLTLVSPVPQDAQQLVHTIPRDHIVIMPQLLAWLDIFLLPLSQGQALRTLLVRVVLSDAAHAQ